MRQSWSNVEKRSGHAPQDLGNSPRLGTVCFKPSSHSFANLTEPKAVPGATTFSKTPRRPCTGNSECADLHPRKSSPW